MELFPSNSNFNFMRARVVSLSLAFIIMVVAFGAMGVNGFNYALDFTGGTVAELRFQTPVEAEPVRQRLETAGFENAVVQTFGAGSDLSAKEWRSVATSHGLSRTAQDRLQQAFRVAEGTG